MPTPWVELRVHGVSGTPPESMLDAPHVRQIDGDAKSRFFRRVDAAGNLIDAPDGPVLEGFHWGRYTSGSLKQSLYIALLPFGLMNMIAYMLPPAHRVDGTPLPGARGARMVSLGLLRFLGLILTLTFAFTLTLVLVQVFTADWFGRDAPTWVRSAPSAALVASGVAIGALGGLAWVRDLRPGSKPRDEDPLAPTPAVVDPPPAEACTAVETPAKAQHRTPFADPRFYRGDPDSPTLRLLHVAGGLLVPSLVVTNPGLPWVDLSAEVVVTTLLASVAFIVTFLGDPEETTVQGGVAASRNRPWHAFAHTLAKCLAVAAAIMLLSVADASDESLTPTRFDVWAGRAVVAGLTVFVLTVVALGVLAVVVRSELPGRGTSAWYFRPFSRGAAPIALLSIATSLAVGLSAAVVVGTLTALNKLGVVDGDDRLKRIGTVGRIAQAWGVVVLVLLAAVVVGWLCWLRTRGKREAAVLAALPSSPSVPEVRLVAWRRTLRNAIWFARLKNHLQGIIWLLFLLGIGLGAFHGAYVAGLVPGLSGRLDRNVAPALGQLGTWTLLALTAMLVSLMRGAFRDANVRRYVNVGWDVIAFWPHAVHPFIQMPYSVRAVGDLAERIRGHLRADPDGTVVVGAHSQGSLLSFAAASSLSDDELQRVRLLTGGSQLRLIFARAFPMYVNYAAITTLHDRLGGRWINLYRDTDPIAGPVLSWNRNCEVAGNPASDHFPDPGSVRLDVTDADSFRTRRCGNDWRLTDPVPRANAALEAPIEKVHGHGNYWTNPVWPIAVGELLARPRAR
jgi:hypothetical protein